MQGEGNTVSRKGIDESGSIPGQQYSIVVCLRLAKVESRGGHGREELFPILTSSRKKRMKSKNHFQRTCSGRTHQSARIHLVISHRLHATISTIKKIKINRWRGIHLMKVRFQANPFLRHSRPLGEL